MFKQTLIKLMNIEMKDGLGEISTSLAKGIINELKEDEYKTNNKGVYSTGTVIEILQDELKCSKDFIEITDTLAETIIAKLS